MTDLSPLAELATRGYAVVRGFLDAQQRHELARVFEEKRVRERSVLPNPNFDIRFLGWKRLARYGPQILHAAQLASTPPAIWDRLRWGIFYATPMGRQDEWHTDTTAHYLTPSYLNFWVPIVKPDPARTGLSVVGFDALAAFDPALADQLRGAGSTRAVQRDGKTIFSDTGRRRVIEVPRANLLDALATTPVLEAGDLLLLCDDVFHRTQDCDTERVAISFRVTSSQTIIRRQTHTDMGAGKFDNLARMREGFARRFSVFRVADRDELTAPEFDVIYDELSRRERTRREELGVTELDSGELAAIVEDLRAARSA